MRAVDEPAVIRIRCQADLGMLVLSVVDTGDCLGPRAQQFVVHRVADALATDPDLTIRIVAKTL